MSLATEMVQVYERETWQADAIVTGQATASASHLSSYATSIYSDYIFVIGNVLKDNAASPIGSRPDMVVTRPGGELTLPDGPVTMVDKRLSTS